MLYVGQVRIFHFIVKSNMKLKLNLLGQKRYCTNTYATDLSSGRTLLNVSSVKNCKNVHNKLFTIPLKNVNPPKTFT